MKNKILIFVIVILLTNFISAYEITITPETITPISMFPGETKTINLTLCHDFKQNQKLDLSYNITNNVFDLNGLYISFSKNPVYIDKCKDVQIFITIPPSYKPDSWVLEIYAETFYKGKKYTSHGIKTIPSACEPNWECSGWSNCADDSVTTRKRTCKDTNNCDYAYNKPNEIIGCETNLPAEQIALSFKSLYKSQKPLMIISLILAIGILTTVFTIRRYKLKQK